MPGTPPTSPNFGAPRYDDGDAATFSEQVNAVTDQFDSELGIRDERVSIQGAAYTATPGDAVIATAAITVTLPDAPAAQSRVVIVATSGDVTVDRQGTDTITQFGSSGLTSLTVKSHTIARLRYLGGVWHFTASQQVAGGVLTGTLDNLAWEDASLVHQPGDLIVSAASARAGCLLCDGSAKSRATYAALFAAIGTNYGAGDGSTTFNVPDFRGRVPLGAGTGPGLTARNLGATGGEESHVLVAGEIPAHSHGVTDPGHTHTVTDPGHVHNITDPGHSHGVTDGGHSHGVTDNGHLHRMFSGNADFMVSGTSGGASLQTGGAFQQEGVPSTDNATTGISVNRSGTGLSVNTAHTGESVNSAQTGVGVGTAETGIATQNAGGGGGHNTMQPYSVVNVFIKT